MLPAECRCIVCTIVCGGLPHVAVLTNDILLENSGCQTPNPMSW